MAGGLPIADKLFDRFAGDAAARQTVPHPFPVLGEQPLSCALVEQLLVVARAMRLLLGIDLQGTGKRRRMGATAWPALFYSQAQWVDGHPPCARSRRRCR
jgi:hypothetical protein